MLFLFIFGTPHALPSWCYLFFSSFGKMQLFSFLRQSNFRIENSYKKGRGLCSKNQTRKLCPFPIQAVWSDEHLLGQMGTRQSPFTAQEVEVWAGTTCCQYLDWSISHTVWVWGDNKKYRALRLDVGNFSWGSECYTQKPKIIAAVCNAPTPCEELHYAHWQHTKQW